MFGALHYKIYNIKDLAFKTFKIRNHTDTQQIGSRIKSANICGQSNLRPLQADKHQTTVETHTHTKANQKALKRRNKTLIKPTPGYQSSTSFYSFLLTISCLCTQIYSIICFSGILSSSPLR
jgi:hypothetical protein